jgi:hypothetical protein
MAKNDSLLQKGDIVVTDRGFLLYRGLAPDGVAADFVAIPNPFDRVSDLFGATNLAQVAMSHTGSCRNLFTARG